MSDQIICPECQQAVDHDRGYLVGHDKDVIRGALSVGRVFCDGSNTKPRVELKTVSYSGTCLNCMQIVRRDETEAFPGSLAKYGGWHYDTCEFCEEAEHYDCAVCFTYLVQADGVWVSQDNLTQFADDPAVCEDGNPHTPRHHPAESHKVLLYDGHVIKEEQQ